MQRFCEDCGAPLEPGVAFCENCGAKIAAPETTSAKSAMQSALRPSLSAALHAAASPAASASAAGEQGIIYTNLNLLCAQTGAEKSAVTGAINSFIADAAARGVSYTLLDVSTRFADAATVAGHVAVIRGVVEKTHAKYLFILGSNTVVPSMVWANEASDQSSDKDVASDLPYATLDTASPFGGQQYNFDDTLRTGRLPNVDLAAYFANLKAGCGTAKAVNSFAMSAEVWQEETRDIYKSISKGAVLTSPECTRAEAAGKIPAQTNVFLFNLHGNDRTEFWYGQRSSSYPEAVEPGSFGHIAQPYFIAVEACYGAAYEGRPAEKSVLLSALGGKCISFLGSSRIAFGTPSAPGCCADVICCEHLKNLCAGMTAGDSLALARKSLMKGDCDAETIKTLAEFSLYGDPSARLKGGTGSTSGKIAAGSFAAGSFTTQTSAKSFALGIRIPQPDVRRAVRRELCTVDEKIRQSVEEAVYGRYPEFAGTKAVFYRNASGLAGSMAAVFSKAPDPGVPVAKILAVSLGAGGRINRIMESK